MVMDVEWRGERAGELSPLLCSQGARFGRRQGPLPRLFLSNGDGERKGGREVGVCRSSCKAPDPEARA